MKVAILGHGTIGSGVYKLIKDNPDFEVIQIFDRPLKRDLDYESLFTSNFNDVITNPKVEIVVETLGGFDFAYDCIKKALTSHKHVVTANKEVVAKALPELISLAKKNKVMFLFEASVGGGIPIIKQLQDLKKINHINKITGILNGTTNYILTRCNEGIKFEDALKDAQDKGFAEKDPTADLEGYDMMRKIAILADLSWDTFIDIDEVAHLGITSIKEEDYKYAKDNNLVIKFICSARKNDNEISLKIRPCFLKASHPFANVLYEYNAVMLDIENHGLLTFIGKGAGSLPTASAILSDLYVILNDGHYDEYQNVNKYKIKKINLNTSFEVLE